MLIEHNIEGINSTGAIIGQDGVKAWKRRQLAFEDRMCLRSAPCILKHLVKDLWPWAILASQGGIL
jgi:hypothetical protein